MSASVSVIIASYNCADTIQRAVQSALAQPEVSDVVLVDDASTDASLGRVNATTRLKLTMLPENRGPAAARNVALRQAKGDFIAILDADDWMEEGRIGRLLRAAGDGWDIAADDLLIAEPDQQPHPLLGSTEVQDITLDDFVARNLPGSGTRRELGYLKPLMRRSFLMEHKIRYPEALRLGEDFVLYARALICGARMRLTPACGYVAEQRPESLSRCHSPAALLALAEADIDLLTFPMTEVQRRLLKRHHRLTLDKYLYRCALEAKAQHDWRKVMRAACGTRSAALYMLRETLAAHLGWRPVRC